MLDRREMNTEQMPPTVIDLTDTTPEPAWILRLADWVDLADTPESPDVSQELRGWSHRLASQQATGSAGERPSAGWLQNLASWIAGDPRPDAAVFAAHITAWADAVNQDAARRARRRSSRRRPAPEPERGGVRTRQPLTAETREPKGELQWSTPLTMTADEPLRRRRRRRNR